MFNFCDMLQLMQTSANEVKPDMGCTVPGPFNSAPVFASSIDFRATSISERYIFSQSFQ